MWTVLFQVWNHRHGHSTSNSLNTLRVRILQILWTQVIPIFKQPNSKTLCISLSPLRFYCSVLQPSCLPVPFSQSTSLVELFIHELGNCLRFLGAVDTAKGDDDDSLDGRGCIHVLGHPLVHAQFQGRIFHGPRMVYRHGNACTNIRALNQLVNDGGRHCIL